jgi:hypothetical protein
MISSDPEDSGRGLFLPSKPNLGRPREGLAYRIVTNPVALRMGNDLGSCRAPKMSKVLTAEVEHQL